MPKSVRKERAAKAAEKVERHAHGRRYRGRKQQEFQARVRDVIAAIPAPGGPAVRQQFDSIACGPVRTLP